MNILHSRSHRAELTVCRLHPEQNTHFLKLTVVQVPPRNGVSCLVGISSRSAVCHHNLSN